MKTVFAPTALTDLDSAFGAAVTSAPVLAYALAVLALAVLAHYLAKALF